jgi:hypothetical protein
MQRFRRFAFSRSLRSSAFTALLLFFASGCATDHPSQQGGAGSSGSGKGGSGGAGGSGGSGVPAGNGGMRTDVVLNPSKSGWIDAMDMGNTVGVQGAWYPYGDKYGVAKCTTVGMHTPEECSTITSPDPLIPGFPNTEGVMCTTGETAVVLPCGAGVPLCSPGDPDYSNMWGAGIGLDLNAEGAADGGTGAKHAYNPDLHGVVGIAFEIDEIPQPLLRVEFPMILPDESSTEDHPDGSPYWDADSGYPPSPVEVGRNELRWDDVKSPRENYAFDRTKILAIQFHVPAITSGSMRGAYHFCIKNLTFLTQ